MALKNVKKEATESINYEVKVTRVKVWDSGAVSLDMVVNGVTIYGATYRSGVTKEGKEYTMVSFPQRKSEKDGKYYNHVYFNISDELLANIEEQIDSLLGE